MTKRYAYDARGKKIYIGNLVKYRNKDYIVKSIDYLNWTTRQYLTLIDQKNKNKKIEFVSPIDVTAIFKRKREL